MLKNALLLAALLLPVGFADAHEFSVGQLQINHPWSQELPPNAPTVAAYFIIHNQGPTADRLTGVDSPIAEKAELHEHVMQGDLMKMQQVPGVDVPAKGEVRFAPMAYHVMLLDLKDRSPLRDGKHFPLTLHFEKAGDVTVEVSVQKQAPDAASDMSPMHAQ
ncbi:copper chaperone PCu(A)C [Pseudomonas gingeri]|uniref:copper chaperone PCu(A)C n=1 Tax=Pseudomonas gingeri TaxID=117681 RepID=UPI00159FFBA3|nr:copper chaperone PCu(A)C [Pseudomonas gingeri]NWD09178.1 copper chaperone PCu(A)C [Pseudomonas gingeri]NWD50059.1 copper chaperone PCu(A)C [Pseudomonas gingeri]NWE34979.1 copper chaperone PCu(A)C [Pseudomonas gingeri]NWE60781.1 copper chaperone PCu(A)C [Pseudomonas gingeri]NWF01140.1 copper chaperone PCu(A)C [Pseudomonas gingeri]